MDNDIITENMKDIYNLMSRCQMYHLVDARKDLISSALATFVAEIVTFPICTLKTNYQNTNNVSIHYTCKNIWNKYGFRGFYNASGWAIGSQMLSTSAKYTFYQLFKDIIPKKMTILDYSFGNTIISGTCSGIASSIITHPVDVVKIHSQMHKLFLPELKTHGVYIFYRGYSKSFFKSGLGSSFFFPLYDMCKNYVYNSTLASLLSAIVSTTIIQPIDYMKTRHIYGQSFFTGYYPVPYFKGLSLNLARVVPHFTIMMTLLELIKSRI